MSVGVQQRRHLVVKATNYLQWPREESHPIRGGESEYKYDVTSAQDPLFSV